METILKLGVLVQLAENLIKKNLLGILKPMKKFIKIDPINYILK